MQTMALILDGVVVNLAIWNAYAEWNPGDEYTVVNVTEIDGVMVGSLYIDGQFYAPPAIEESEDE